MRQTVIRSRPEGMALFVVMMLLLVMSIAGVAMLRTGILEERMAAVTFDRALALQAAEIALRKGEERFNKGEIEASIVPDWSDAQSIKPALTVNGIVTNSYYLVLGARGEPGTAGAVLEVPIDVKNPALGKKSVVSVWSCSAASLAECKTGSVGERAVVILKSTYDRFTDKTKSHRTSWQEIERKERVP